MLLCLPRYLLTYLLTHHRAAEHGKSTDLPDSFISSIHPSPTHSAQLVLRQGGLLAEMNAERDELMKRPFTPGLDPGLKTWLAMRRELAESKKAGGHNHVIRATKYKYRNLWRAEMHERILPEMRRTGT